MAKDIQKTEALACQFLQRARELHTDIEPIRVLKARAYRIGNANVLIRSASKGKSGRYFFGLNYITAEEVANLDNPFFAFICDEVDQTLIIPGSVLTKHLPLISHDCNGEYKINIDKNLDIVLSGRGHRLNCSGFVNAWSLLLNPPEPPLEKSTVEESLHSVLQGRLIEIGKIRGYETFCPDKSKKFNGAKLSDISTLRICPKLQFSDHELLRQIDVIWFRKGGSKNHLVPEYAFEVEISTGTWSGVGRMATLLDYMNVRLYIISNDLRKYERVMNAYSSFQNRYRHVLIEDVGELYASEKNLRDLRSKVEL